MLRLAHITDLHLRHHQPGSSRLNARRSRRMAEALAAALSDLKARGVDAVVLTGDLLDVPGYYLRGEEAYDYQRPAWTAEIELDYALIRTRLETSGIPFLALPGNHDAWGAFHRAFPEDELLVQGHRLIRFCDREHQAPLRPQRVGEQRHAFLAALADPSLPQIHCQHYVIAPELNAGYPHTYWDHEDIVRRLSAVAHVPLAISGHYHRGTELLRLGRTAIATGPAFAEYPHPYRIFELGDGVTMHQHALGGRHPTPVVFLDRDGVITVDASYHDGPERLRLIPGAAAAIAQLRAAGLAVVVVTSQSCVGQGFVTEDMLEATHDRMYRLLRDAAGDAAMPDALYASLGAGDKAIHPAYRATDDAKPNPVHPAQAAQLLDLAPGGWFVGDRPTDLICAQRSGCTPILVRTGDGAQTAARLAPEHARVAQYDDLLAAAQHIIAVHHSRGVSPTPP